MSDRAKFLRVYMPDANYDIPIEVIARSRAAHYADEFGGNVERSLTEDTMPLFDRSPWVADEWASDNMNWSDVSDHAIRVERPPCKPNFELAWLSSSKEVIEK